MTHCLTFDIEEHFQVSAFDSPMRRRHWSRLESRVEGNTAKLLDLLETYGVRATFFVLGWVAERHPSLVRRIANANHEVASHGYAHELITAQTPGQFREDVRRAKGILEDIIGAAVLGYRAPSFTITRETLWALPILVEEGYAYDSSVFPILHNRYGLPGACPWPHRLDTCAGLLWEIPPSTVKIAGFRSPIAGGGYLRLYPFQALRWLLKRAEAAGHPLVMYLHAWELDPHQPRMNGPLLSRFRHYVGLHKTEERLRQLLRDFAFAPIRDVILPIGLLYRQRPTLGAGDGLVFGAGTRAPRSSMVRPEVKVTHDVTVYNAYVAAHPQATQYHQYDWLGVISRSIGHRAIPLAAVSGGHLAGVLPLVLMDSWLFGRFIVSLPFVNYGGLLGDAEEIERLLWNAAVEIVHDERAAYLEVRHTHPRPFIAQRKQHKVTMILDLAPTTERQWKAFDPKLRNQIRKADRSGLSARVGGATDLPGFYEVFARNMRDLGTPVYTRRFFEEILNTFPEASQIFSVQSGATTIAAGIAMVYRDTLEMPWAASRRGYHSMCPNNLLYWEVIQHAIKAGLKRFDFGRSTPGDGAYTFKKQWGARPVPLAWEYWTAADGKLPDISPRNPKYELAIRLWKRLPVAVANKLGPSVVRNIP